MQVEAQKRRKNNRRKTKKKRFKFETGWFLDEACEGIVRGAWKDSNGGTMEDRFGMLVAALTGWGRGKLDDLAKKIKDAEKQLKVAQELEVTEFSVQEC